MPSWIYFQLYFHAQQTSPFEAVCTSLLQCQLRSRKLAVASSSGNLEWLSARALWALHSLHSAMESIVEHCGKHCKLSKCVNAPCYAPCHVLRSQPQSVFQISEASGSSSTIPPSAEPQVGPSRKDPAVKFLSIVRKSTGQIAHIDHKDGTSASEPPRKCRNVQNREWTRVGTCTKSH